MNPEFAKEQELLEFSAKQLAKLYAEVFGAPPWNEVWRCPQCNRFYGPEYLQDTPSPCCFIPLVIAYPEEETIAYIKEELSQPKAKFELFYSSDGQLIAFAWGYEIKNATTLVQKKWPQSERVQSQVAQAISEYTNPNLPLYYISEVGVAYSFRGNGIGFQLTKDLLDYGTKFLQEPVIFRTNWASPMMKIATRLQMFQIMGPKIKIVNGQIVKTEEIAKFIDEVNPDRTLFIKTP